MRNFLTICGLLFLSLLLAGCTQALGDIKNAAAGINSKANEAATSISLDVHSVRAVEIQFDHQTFTINDLFKSILRDVQWHYEKKDDQNELKITGTWNENGLFASHNFDDTMKKQLTVNGHIEVILSFENNVLNEEKTVISMYLHQEKLVEQHGKDDLHALYALYLENIPE
ncbi:23S rRNA methyltransferase [Solibacillus sp. R5-41]|uniref:23S rRNA methyltransferase n=1 Tax=Solibacillus sp. R5-41 TaxID=2048654 RepID=UPI000C125B02|nr:23S rRNA methyltransferase [Solibacillus sp. R5-41]ATP41158.1 23S rRNA methyltransferase [Solibacillus sp. R5-41]